VHYLAQAGYFFLLLGGLVFVHELGHFVVAKLCRVKVLRFSFGLGPRLLGLRVGPTDYCISAIPFGGFVKLLGEDPADQVPATDRGRAFFHKPLWQRFLVVLAGPSFNLLLPVGIYFVFFAAQRTLPAAVCGSVLRGQPAEGRLVPGDRVVAVDGRPVRYWDDLEAAIAARPGATVRLTVQRGKEIVQVFVPVRPHSRRMGPLASEVGMIGISPRSLQAEIGVLDPASPAAQAGLRSFDLVTTVNTEPVGSFGDLERRLPRDWGDPLRLTYLRGQASGLAFADLELRTPASALILPVLDRAGGRSQIGIEAGEFFLHEVEPQSPLAAAGLRAGDRVVALDGAPLGSWELFEEALASDPGREHTIEWRSADGPHSARFRPQVHAQLDEYKQRRERIVHGAVPRPLWRLDPPLPIESPLVTALGRAFARTGSIAADMARATAALLRGRISHETLGGPILVLQIAGVAAERGWEFFLATLALISINIGLINLLPIPALDGGHLLFFTIEAARRKPISARARSAANYVGLVVILSLVGLALKNDLVRYLLR